MFRKIRRPTPYFQIPPPYNPLTGDNETLQQEGTFPYCAMMQIAEDDEHENFVICRGFDPRILKFIDYEAGSSEKLGISVAKPFGKRVVDTYQKAEIYPALLPIQGKAPLRDSTPFTPPSPSAVKWRLGQNPGYVAGGQEGGQPESLDDEIQILYDHNGKVINWILIDNSESSASRTITGIVTAVGTEASGDFSGLAYADVNIIEASDPGLLGTSARIHDRKGCIFDIDVTDYCVWAHELWGITMDTEKECDVSVKYWSADDRCCESGTAIYRECQE